MKATMRMSAPQFRQASRRGRLVNDMDVAEAASNGPKVDVGEEDGADARHLVT